MTESQLDSNQNYYLHVFKNSNYYIFKDIQEIFKIDRVNKTITGTDKGLKALVKNTRMEFWTKNEYMKQFRFIKSN